jgi:hypothetical protein
MEISGHTGIYTGEGTFVHEPAEGKVCCEVSVEEFMNWFNAAEIYYCHYIGE